MSRTATDEKKWEKQVEPFVADLRLGYAELLDRKRLIHGFESTVKSPIDLAASLGFSPGWNFQQR